MIRVLAGEHGGGMAEEAMSGPVLCHFRLSFYCRRSRGMLGILAVCRHLRLTCHMKFLFDLDLQLAACATRTNQEVAGGKVGRAGGFLEVVENKGERNFNCV